MTRRAFRRQAARGVGTLDLRSVQRGVVLTMLSWKWSPEQIAATLNRVFLDQPERQVSNKTIYTAIYAHARGELRCEMIA